MNNFNIKALVITITLAFGAGAMAQNVTETDYKAGKEEGWLSQRHPEYAYYAKRVRKLVPWVY